MLRTNEKASQNRYRDAQYPQKRISSTEVDCGFAENININDRRMGTKPLRLAELVEHYRQKELSTDNEWKTLSTRITYEGYLRKWIVPRWGATSLSAIQGSRG